MGLLLCKCYVFLSTYYHLSVIIIMTLFNLRKAPSDLLMLCADLSVFIIIIIIICRMRFSF